MNFTKAIASAIILGITAGVCLLYLTGCTVTTFKSGSASVTRVSFLQAVQAQSVTLGADGSASLTGYGNDGGAATAGVVTREAVSAAIHAIK